MTPPPFPSSPPPPPDHLRVSDLEDALGPAFDHRGPRAFGRGERVRVRSEAFLTPWLKVCFPSSPPGSRCACHSAAAHYYNSQ
jgi:hypothetical protein